MGVAGFDDLRAGHRIHETAGEGGDDDLVARIEIVDVDERLAVGRAVAGDRGVAVLAGEWRVRVVAWPAPQVVDRDAFDDDDVEPDLGDLETGDRIPIGDRHRRWGRHRWQHGVRHCVRRGVRHGVDGALDGGVTAVVVEGAEVVDVAASSESNSSSSSFWARAASMPVPHSW